MGITTAKSRINLGNVPFSVDFKQIDIDNTAKAHFLYKICNQGEQLFLLEGFRLIGFSCTHFQLFLNENRNHFAAEHVDVDVCTVFLSVHELLNHQSVLTATEKFHCLLILSHMNVQTRASAFRLDKNRIGQLAVFHRMIEFLPIQKAASRRKAKCFAGFIHRIFMEADIHLLCVRHDGHGSDLQKTLLIVCKKRQLRVDQGKYARDLFFPADLKNFVQITGLCDPGHQHIFVRFINGGCVGAAVRCDYLSFSGKGFFKILHDLVSRAGA